MTARRFLGAALSLCAALAWSGAALAYNELPANAAKSGANADITSLSALTAASFAGSAGSARQLAWKTSGNTIWGLSITGSNDHTFGIFAYSPVDGSFIGNPLLFNSTTLTVTRNWLENDNVVGAPAVSGTLGQSAMYHNTGGNPAQATGTTYFTNAGAANAPGFDVATTRFLINNSSTFPSGGNVGMATDWVVAIGPTTVGNWGLGDVEYDTVKRSQDDGLRTIRSTAANPAGAVLAVAETQTFSNGGNTFNADWAFTVARSGGNNPVSGFPNKWYVGYFCAEDSTVGLLGYCNYAEGDNTSTASQYPYSPYGAGGTFLHGFDLTAATFGDALSVRAAPGQGYGFVSGAFTAGMGSTGSGAAMVPTLFADGAVQATTGANPTANQPITLTGGTNGGANGSIIIGGTVGFNIQFGSSAFLGQSGFNMLSLTTTNAQLAPKNGNVILGGGSSLATNTIVGFLSLPFMSGTPTGTPTYAAGAPSCVWNDASFTLDCYSIGAGAWKHMTFSAGAA